MAILDKTCQELSSGVKIFEFTVTIAYTSLGHNSFITSFLSDASIKFSAINYFSFLTLLTYKPDKCSDEDNASKRVCLLHSNQKKKNLLQ